VLIAGPFAARARMGGADGGDHTRIRQTDRQLQSWASPSFRCAVRRADRVGGGEGCRWPAWQGEKEASNEGGPSEEGRGVSSDVVSKRGAPRFQYDFPAMFPKGRVSACLCAAMRSAPGSGAGGVPCG